MGQSEAKTILILRSEGLRRGLAGSVARFVGDCGMEWRLMAEDGEFGGEEEGESACPEEDSADFVDFWVGGQDVHE